MKKLLIKALVCCAFLSGTSLSACSESKIYVDTADAYQVDNHFRVRLKTGDWIDAKSLHGDDVGVYIYQSAVIEPVKCWEIVQQEQWQCKGCGFFWPVFLNTCANKQCKNFNPDLWK
jgi:hypothetical protein